MNQILIEAIGTVGTLLVVASMFFKTQTLKGSLFMRIANLSGSAFLIVYSIFLSAFSNIALNIALVIINGVHIVLLLKSKKNTQTESPQTSK